MLPPRRGLALFEVHSVNPPDDGILGDGKAKFSGQGIGDLRCRFTFNP